MLKHILMLILLANLYSLKAQNWKLDLEEAKQEALVKNKKIILAFQGSDWCAPCIKLDREILSTDEFKFYAESHFVMLKADFPRKKKNQLSKTQQLKNNELAEKFNKQGFFPYLVVLDKNGKKLGSIGYKKTTPSEYINLLNSL